MFLDIHLFHLIKKLNQLKKREVKKLYCMFVPSVLMFIVFAGSVMTMGVSKFENSRSAKKNAFSLHHMSICSGQKNDQLRDDRADTYRGYTVVRVDHIK